METNCLSDLTDVCGQLTDPRAANAKHKLTNILILAILGVLAGANTWAPSPPTHAIAATCSPSCSISPRASPATTPSRGSSACSTPMPSSGCSR